MCRSLVFNKVAGLRPETLLKTRLWHRCFPVNFVKLSRTLFLQSTSGRLLLFPQHSHSQHSLLCILSWFYSFRTLLVKTNINGLKDSIRLLSEVLLFFLLSYLVYKKMPDSSIINYEKTNFEISVADFLIPVLYF